MADRIGRYDHKRRRTKNLGGRSNFARMSKAKSENCPNFLLFLQEDYPKVANFCSTRGAAAPCHALSYAYGLMHFYISMGCSLRTSIA